MEWFNLGIYTWCVFGIVVSVVLPGLWTYVRQYFKVVDPNAKAMFDWNGLWQLIKPYVALGVTSALTAAVLLIVLHDTLVDYRAAFLAGYAWDSTLQKLR